MNAASKKIVKPASPLLKKAAGPKPPTRAAIRAQQKHGGLGHVGRGLGGGLNTLITPATPAVKPAVPEVKPAAAPAPVAPPAPPLAEIPETEKVLQVPPQDIVRCPFQPRTEFRRDELDDLVESIRENGVIQPLTCRRRADGKLELICGERRQRASIEAGLKLVPVVLKDVPDDVAAVMAITENLQRDNLNPIEEAEGYQALKTRFNLTYDEVARRVGKKNRSSVANLVGLLELPVEVRDYVRRGAISLGHAKVLQGVLSKYGNPTEVRELADACVAFVDSRTGRTVPGITVRELERRVVRLHMKPVERRPGTPDIPESYCRQLVEELHKHLGCAVRLTSGMTHANGKHVKGLLEIDFIDNDDLDRILALIGVKMD